MIEGAVDRAEERLARLAILGFRQLRADVIQLAIAQAL
jgi:hypothetical protein